MNYLEHHLGDYAKRALSFSMLEHGAYSVLRDRYFTKEEPIPSADVYRVASARTRDERAAVDAVLSEFYRLDDGAWRCDEFDAQLEVARNKITAAQQNGKKGGRPKKNRNETEEKPTGFSVGSISETQVKAHARVPSPQSPDTNTQIPERERSSPAPAREGPAEPGTAYGAASRAMRLKGMADAYPSDRRLRELVDQGATPDEFGDVAEEAVRKGKGFAWALTALIGRRADATTLRLPPKAANNAAGWRDRQLAGAAVLTGTATAAPTTTETVEVIDAETRRIAP